MTLAEKGSLLKEWIKFKKAENAQKKKRVDIENKLISIYGTNFEGSSKTFREEDLGFSINLKKNIKISLDQKKWKEIRNQIPENLRPEKIIFELDTEGFKFLKKSKEHKDVYLMVSGCVTEKENKVTIGITKI